LLHETSMIATFTGRMRQQKSATNFESLGTTIREKENNDWDRLRDIFHFLMFTLCVAEENKRLTLYPGK
jgi:hypothetical protein